MAVESYYKLLEFPPAVVGLLVATLFAGRFDDYSFGLFAEGLVAYGESPG